MRTSFIVACILMLAAHDAYAQDYVAAARNLWVPAVNNHDAFGRWAFLEITDIYEATKQTRAFLDSIAVKQAAE